MILDQILAFLLLYKYSALFGITFFASLLNITPASPSLIICGSFIANSYLNYWQVFLVGYFGAVLGDITSYIISYHYSRNVLTKIGFKRLLNSKSFSKVEGLFKRNSGKTIFISRFFLTSFGPIVNLIAGFAKVNYKEFILYTMLGEVLYIFILTGIGYLFVDNWEYVTSILDYISVILIIIVIILIYLYIERKNNPSLNKQ